jgi:hypothetical protein
MTLGKMQQPEGIASKNKTGNLTSVADDGPYPSAFSAFFGTK